MSTVKSYRDLLVWQRAMDLSELVYSSTKGFPKDEIYGLTSQIRRSSVSVPSNIAEGHARNSTKSFIYFLNISRGSLAETETQILLAQRFNYISPEKTQEILELAAEVSRMLAGLKRSMVENGNFK